MTATPTAMPLSRFTVLELTVARAGPTAARQLADWGAEVIKIEPPAAAAGEGDPDALRHAADFQNLNRGRRCLTLDLKAPEGVAVLHRLAADADVVIENFRPDVKHRLGIDYETLSAINPRLVYASISGFGQDGPYRDRPGVDQIAQGLCGLMSITGTPEHGPMRVGIPIADLCTGVLTAFGVLVALLERETSGRGQWVRSSLVQSLLFMLDFQAARWLVDGEVPRQAGNDHPTIVPTGVFRTRDGAVNIATIPTMWRRFCAAIGADLADDPELATPPLRSANRARLNAAIEAITLTEDTATWIARMNAEGIPCGPINTIDRAFADPQIRHLEVVQSVVSPVLGPLSLVRQPLDMDRTPAQPRGGVPERGADTDAILAAAGYDAAAVADLRRRGIV